MIVMVAVARSDSYPKVLHNRNIYVTLCSMKTNTYLTALIERQQAEGWSDRQMAREVGIGHVTWYRIRLGETTMGRRSLSRLMARFPEYNDLALLFLRSSAAQSNTNAAEEHREDAA